jgi:uncharacterized protein (DUF427 family)
MADHIKIRTTPEIWSVRAGGSVLGETKAALELAEGSYPPVIYFPRGDIAMALLEKTEKTTHCPHKGDASYYSIVTSNGTFEDAVWSYENPKDGMEAIKDHLAFYQRDGITLESL